MTTEPESPISDPGVGADGEAPAPAVPRPARRTSTPQGTLNAALAVYVIVNLVIAVPLLVFPGAFFDFVGVDALVARELDGLRWIGAVFMAWAVSGVLVLARPGGRAIFVTTGALQMTFAGLVLLYSWSVREFLGSPWFHATLTVITVATATFMWWARLRGRKVLTGKEA